MADETKKVYLTFNTRFTHTTTTTFEDAQGVLRPLIRVSIPKGTELGGRDLGGSSFLARYALPSKFNEREVSFAFIPGQTVQLSAPVRGEDGTILDYEKLPVQVEALKAAVDAQRRAWREAHPRQEVVKDADARQEDVDVLDEIDAAERQLDQAAGGELIFVGPYEENPLENLDN